MSFTHTPVNYVPLEYRRAMLAIIVDRIRDEAATVRTRALSILSELISNRCSPTVLHLMQDIFVKPYLNMSSISNITNSKENDFLKWKTFVASLDKVSWENFKFFLKLSIGLLIIFFNFLGARSRS